MHRFLLPRPFDDGEAFAAEGRDFHYLANVLRLSEGAELTAGDPAGGTYVLQLEKKERKRLFFRVTRVQPQPRIGCCGVPEIVLLICLPKPDKMDLIVRMTTETGVDRIVPVTSDYSVVSDREAQRLDARRERWEKIARAAFEQCGRMIPPVIEPIGRLADAAPAHEDEVSLFADERGGAALHDVIGGRLGAEGTGAEAFGRVRIIIGPEGGLSDAERSALAAKGFIPVLLGGNILRTETAAVVACAAVRLLITERNSWKRN